MAKWLYIEPFSGIAGDMFAAAAYGLLEDKAGFLETLGGLALPEPYGVRTESVSRGGIRAERFIVEVRAEEGHRHHGHGHSHGRTLSEIRSLIAASNGLSEQCKALAGKIFSALAEAESAVHGENVDKVHFHEVGATDAIVDIVAAALAMEKLGAERVVSTPTALGRGVIHSAHGLIPAPSPATVQLLRGLPTRQTDIPSELTTPTGAAILKTLVDEWDGVFKGRSLAVAYGAGSRDLKGSVNALRLSLYEIAGGAVADTVAVLECQMDDFSGEGLTPLGPALLENGALDYAILPATMKKGRQGFVLQVLCPPERSGALRALLLRETSTLGVRYRLETRTVLRRETVEIDSPYGKIPIKVAIDEHGDIVKVKPEQRALEAIAKARRASYPEVAGQAEAAAWRWVDERRKKRER